MWLYVAKYAMEFRIVLMNSKTNQMQECTTNKSVSQVHGKATLEQFVLNSTVAISSMRMVHIFIRMTIYTATASNGAYVSY